jgi:methyltransferase-like protein
MKQVSLREKKMVLNNAVASVEMEGYKISDNEKELCMEVLDGKLTKDEFIKIMLEKVQND